jgi:septal ring factor EnvC (AmiA/AmiB activator)
MKDLKDVKQERDDLRKQLQFERHELKVVKQQRDDLKAQLELVQFEQSELKSRLSKFFGKDQIGGMERKSSKGMPWTDATVEKCIKLRYGIGERRAPILLYFESRLLRFRTFLKYSLLKTQ